MGYVYFIQCGTRVKIGYASDVRQRFSCLQVASPEPLTLRAVVEAVPPNDEGTLHKRFRAYRRRGEWFALEGELAEYVDGLPIYETEDGRSLRQTGRDGLFNFRSHPGLRDACMGAAKAKGMKLAEWMEFHLVAALESEDRDTSFLSEAPLCVVGFGADSLEPAPGGTLDFDDFFNAYVAAARANRFPAYAGTAFVAPFKRLCQEAGIRLSRERERLFLCDVRLSA